MQEPLFDDYAVAELPIPAGYGQLYRQWLDKGYGDNMAYLAEPSRAAADCGRPWAKYAVVLAKQLPLRLESFPLPPDELADVELVGSVSLYALGNDYHVVLPKLAADFIAEWGIVGLTEITVDTKAVNERSLALASGLAKRGRHGSLIHSKLGTHFVLAVVFCAELPVELAAKARKIEPEEVNNPCGNCHLCEQSCPAGALINGCLDARRCLSYWSIEHRGEFDLKTLPTEETPLFGCDLCLRVCPHSHLGCKQLVANSQAIEKAEEFILNNSNKYLEKALRGTAYSRARGNGLKRNCLFLKKK